MVIVGFIVINQCKKSKYSPTIKRCYLIVERMAYTAFGQRRKVDPVNQSELNISPEKNMYTNIIQLKQR
jgi:hypothetical protein